MKDGYGSPYIKVFTSLGEVTSRVVDYTYKFSQKEDDLCQIRVESGDPNLPDYPEFQEGVILKLVWGYLGETNKLSREVIIRNIKAAYTEKIISLDILCTDRASRIKDTSSKKVHSGTLKEIANSIAVRNGLGLNMDGGGNNDSLTATNVRQTAYLAKDGNFKDAIDNTLVAKTITYRFFDTLPQANKSDYNILREAADNDPNGPFEITGRDNIISIKKIDTSQKPLKSYTWSGGDGELLIFTPESKGYPRGKGSKQMSSTGFNPSNKTAFDLRHNEFTNGQSKIGVVTSYSPRFTSSGLSNAPEIAPSVDVTVGEDKKLRVLKVPKDSSNANSTINAGKPISKTQPNTSAIDSNTQKPKNIEVAPSNSTYSPNEADGFGDTYVAKTDNSLLAFGTLNTESTAYKNSLGNFTTAVSTTAVIKPIALIKSIDYNSHIPNEEHAVDDAEGKGKNKQTQNALDKNPAEAKMVGSWDLESGKVLTILGASKKFSGNYYMWEAIHRVTPGYAWVVDAKMSKNALGKTGAESPITLPVNRFDSISPADITTDINKQIGPEQVEKTNTPQSINATSPNPVSPGLF